MKAAARKEKHDIACEKGPEDCRSGYTSSARNTRIPKIMNENRCEVDDTPARKRSSLLRRPSVSQCSTSDSSSTSSGDDAIKTGSSSPELSDGEFSRKMMRIK